MTDRTMIDVAGKAFSVPRLLKRTLQVLTAMGLTAIVTLVIIAANSMLTAKGGTVAGFNTWLGFIQRPEIIGTMVLTAVVTVLYLHWDRRSGGNGGRR